MKTRIIITLTVIALCAPIVSAQQHPKSDRGFSPEKLYQFSDIDSVNVYNGNVNLALPVGPTLSVSSNLSYGLHLAYNSKVWDYDQEGSVRRGYPNKTSNAGISWILSMGRLIGPYDDPDAGSVDFVYESADGNQHRFVSTRLHENDPLPSLTDPLLSVWYTACNRITVVL